MLHAKTCHQGLRPRSQLFGLEPLDALLLFPALYVCTVLLGQMLLGIVVAALLAGLIRLLKWGRLPGYSLTLLTYLLLAQHNAALGYDRAPRYPRT